MFNLVADVERYPEFLPLCDELIITSTKERGSKQLLLADMTVNYKLFRETFTSQVLLDPENLAIDTQYVNGPFKHMNSQWRFKELGPDSCEVSFVVDYAFKSRMLAMAAGAFFEMGFKRFVSAFEERADTLYADTKIATV